MLRGKLLAVLLGVLALLAVSTILLQNRLASELTDRVEKKVQSGNESVRMANRVDDYSLIRTAEQVAALSGLEEAFGCPLTEEAQGAMAARLGADSLRYLPVESVARSIGFAADELCQACLTGHYPAGIIEAADRRESH